MRSNQWMQLRRLLVCSLTLATAPLGAGAEDEEPIDLPIREVTLYRSGVGAFMREATVEGEARAELRFDVEQVNDILKSLLVLDLDGGEVRAVQYDSEEPLDRRLASFGIDLSDNPSVAEIFKRLRGSGLRVSTAEGDIEGTILGVEERATVHRASEDPAVVREMYVSLVTERGVRTIGVSEILAFEPIDEELARELSQALGAIREQRDERLKSVELGFSGPAGKDRSVVVGYVHEMPVWKTTYRLVLAGDDEPLTMQGWAIVENTTDSDWENVRLSLASGRPVGFRMNLYEPIFAPRRVLPVPVTGGVVAREYESASPRAAPPGDQRADHARRGAELVLDQSRGIAALEESVMADTSVNQAMSSADVSAADVGGQFMYTLGSPVTIERQRSAMLPILLAEVDGRRVSIFSPNDNLPHPMRGVELINDSGLHFMPGPVSVYDADTYAGDSQIPHTSRGQKRLLGYALDIDVRAETEVENESGIVRIRIVDGLVEQTVRRSQARVYSFSNYDSTRGRTVIVEEPKRSGWDLVRPEQPAGETAGAYRFEVEVGPSDEASLEVVQEDTVFQRLGITSIDLETILSFQRRGKASEAVVNAIRKASSIQGRLNDLERALEAVESERSTIANDQRRLRENLARIDRNSDLGRRYIAKMTEQEDRLDQLEQQRQRMQRDLEAAREELEMFLRDLTVE